MASQIKAIGLALTFAAQAANATGTISVSGISDADALIGGIRPTSGTIRLVESGDDVPAVATDAVVGQASSMPRQSHDVVRPFQMGIALIAAGLSAAGATLFTDLSYLPSLSTALTFVGCAIAADASQKHRDGR